ncbi:MULTISPECIES: hypothetical protein [Rhizobium]|uniref:Uncharacterized protein n=1 Tax=Rhizobium tumorigenes TaxID=2041385 RepID=A0AAF1KTJ4_9HYPH|nr:MULTISPECIES: hypothetical protein [Rhizobium]MBO9101871.1 hypothetical protein [Rhizobium sp. L58/93]MBO9172042.1 hypothetical protein [Rhizobium sp. L245/93]MBO9187902.1 hypothetical protein [Rhizobium sp. E27B/91]QXZ87671.1 hypothetical protein J5287_26985 [Rhizobium sp. K1/93]QXZ93712.1 hypothetical protein J5280_26985 [Rhizobium sp. K15/93]
MSGENHRLRAGKVARRLIGQIGHEKRNHIPSHLSSHIAIVRLSLDLLRLELHRKATVTQRYGIQLRWHSRSSPSSWRAIFRRQTFEHLEGDSCFK